MYIAEYIVELKLLLYNIIRHEIFLCRMIFISFLDYSFFKTQKQYLGGVL